jgi:hypothetical protein
VLVFACCIGELGDLIAFRDTRAIQQINARSAGQRDGELRLSGVGLPQSGSSQKPTGLLTAQCFALECYDTTVGTCDGWKPLMSPTFSQAVAAAMEGYDAQSWHELPQTERARLIYAAMRKIDAETVKGRLITSGERRAA